MMNNKQYWKRELERGYNMKGNVEYRPLTSQYDSALAELIRINLEAYHLDIPGTVYFDESLDHLSRFYSFDGRAYYVLLQNDMFIGGVGFSEFDGDCCELQKLYLADAARGQGLGCQMIAYIENRAREMGYKRMYLETHSSLQAAVHIYEKTGYVEIPRPENVVHSTMNKFYLKEL